jgi:hypothetical protein
MRISVKGSSQLEIPEWTDAVDWMGGFLLGRTADNIRVRLNLTYHLPGGHCGYILCDDWDSRRKFSIFVETGKCGRRKQLYTLAHEMIHMKQIVRHQLSVRQGTFFWRSTTVLDDPEPWETEALELERTLYKLWREAVQHK